VTLLHASPVEQFKQSGSRRELSSTAAAAQFEKITSTGQNGVDCLGPRSLKKHFEETEQAPLTEPMRALLVRLDEKDEDARYRLKSRRIAL
jgi:hypothetical protein